MPGSASRLWRAKSADRTDRAQGPGKQGAHVGQNSTGEQVSRWPVTHQTKTSEKCREMYTAHQTQTDMRHKQKERAGGSVQGRAVGAERLQRRRRRRQARPRTEQRPVQLPQIHPLDGRRGRGGHGAALSAGGLAAAASGGAAASAANGEHDRAEAPRMRQLLTYLPETVSTNTLLPVNFPS